MRIPDPNFELMNGVTYRSNDSEMSIDSLAEALAKPLRQKGNVDVADPL